jgi:PAS domain S-box-containing protein
VSQDAELLAEISRSQSRGHLRSLGPASVISLMGAVLAVGLLADVAPPSRLGGWLALIGLVLWGRMWFTRRWRLQPDADALSATSTLRVATLVHGLAWSLVAWLPPAAPDAAVLLMLTVVTTGMSAIGLTLALYDRLAAALMVLPMLLSLLLRAMSAATPLPQTVVVAFAYLSLLTIAMLGSAAVASRRRSAMARRRLDDLNRLHDVQRAETVMRRVFDHVGEGLGLFDEQWRLQVWNDRLLSLLGLDPSIARAGLPLRECLRHLADRGEYGDVDPAAEVERRFQALTHPGGGVWQRSRPDGRLIETRRSLLENGGLTMVAVDITERRASERALVENQRMLSLLLENTEEGFWFIDNQLLTTDANRAMRRMLRAELGQMLGRTIYDFVDAENEQIFRRQVALRDQGQAGSYEIALRRTDGTLVHCYNNATPIYDGTGAKIGAVGLFSDISAQKSVAADLQRASELLADKSRVLESTLENLSQGVLSFAPDGRVEAWNQQVLDLLQVPESLLLQKPTLREVVRWQLAQGHIQPDLGMTDRPGQPIAQHFVDGSDEVVWERRRYQRVRNDGVVIEVQAHAAPDGAQVRTYTDVTDRVHAQQALQESESRFRTMADAAPALIWQSDAAGQPVWFNETWLRLLGCSMSEAVEGNRFRHAIHPDDYRRVQEVYERAFAQRSDYDLEARVRLPDGRDLWVADKGIPRFDTLGRFDGFISYGWDITSRKAAERALTAARDEAERANRAKSEFLSRMSHELRTPLNAVLGFAQLIDQDPHEPPRPMQRERILQIQRGGVHLLQLINEVLDLSRIESGALSLHVEAVDVDAVVSECRLLVEPMASQYDVSLQVEAPAGGWGTIHTDATRLRQVLLNLLSNAIKYNVARGRVQVSGMASAGVVRMDVVDTGPGLTPEKQQRLFQAFERLGADRGAVEGTGIGLALSKSLVDLMHGTIGVNSEVGQGSTFWVELPRGTSAEPVSATAAPAAFEPAAAPPPPAWQGPARRVLYIEDNAVNQIIVESMLSHLPGVSLALASDPEQGLALARAEPPDLVLLDIQLPRMSGFEVLQRLRADPATRQVPVIAVSANAMPEDLARARDAGFDHYLSKPLNLAGLLKAVSEMLDKAKA